MSTLPENDRLSGPLNALAAQVEFDADFPLIDAPGDPAGTSVVMTRIRAGVTTHLVLGDFAVSAQGENGFTLALAVPALAGDEYWIAGRQRQARLRAHPLGGAVRTPTLEDDAMEAAARDQEAARDLGRALLFPFGEEGQVLPGAAARAGKFLATDGTGRLIFAAGVSPGTVPVAEFMAALLASVDQAAFLAALGAIDSNGVGFTAAGAGAVARTARDKLRDSVSVMDFIPISKHAGIRAGTNAEDLTAYFQAAAVASRKLNGELEAHTGHVLIPNGLYHLTRVGIRGVVFVGESRGGAIIRAFSVATADKFMFDAMLDTDGVTPNTYGGGWCENLTLDGRLPGGDAAVASGRSGLRTYGGGLSTRELTIRYCGFGMAVGLPIACSIQAVYIHHCNVGYYTFHDVPGDNGTSTTFLNCWAHACTTYGFHISQLFYSSFINCVAQDSGFHNFFVEGNLNHAALYSLQFIGCATEGTGTPFYFKNVRELTLANPRIILPAANIDYVVFDNTTGSIRDFSTAGAPSGGFHHLDVLNPGGGQHSIVLSGGTVTYDPAHEIYIVNAGAWANGVPKLQAERVRFNHVTAANRIEAVIEDVDGYGGLVIKANDGTELAKFRRIGSQIFNTNGPINDLAANLNPLDVTFDVAGDNLVFRYKTGAGVVKTATLTPDP